MLTFLCFDSSEAIRAGSQVYTSAQTGGTHRAGCIAAALSGNNAAAVHCGLHAELCWLSESSISQCFLQVVLTSWATATDYLIVRCRQLLPSIILQKVLEFADVLPNSRIVSCDGLMNNVCGSKRLECSIPASAVPLKQLAHLRAVSMPGDKLLRA